MGIELNGTKRHLRNVSFGSITPAKNQLQKSRPNAFFSRIHLLQLLQADLFYASADRGS
jgi:hypothetical protein